MSFDNTKIFTYNISILDHRILTFRIRHVLLTIDFNISLSTKDYLFFAKIFIRIVRVDRTMTGVEKLESDVSFARVDRRVVEIEELKSGVSLEIFCFAL